MNLLTKLRYVPKRFGVIAAVIAAGATATLSFAWGPERPTYTIANPADHITFNSITDNTVAGDERNFVVVKDAADTQSGGWQDTVAVEPGKEYLVRVYVHNNAASSLNLTATNTRVAAALGQTGTKVGLTGYVTADNASPQEVYDDAYFTSSNAFAMNYVSGSAMIYNNATGQAGRSVSDEIMSGAGALVGYSANDGKVPGCFQYASYVTFKVKPQFDSATTTSDFTVAKTVRLSDSTDKTFKESVNAKPGDKVDFQVYFKNTGDSELSNVVVRDTLPAGLTYVPGSTWLHNSAGTSQVADGITSANGITTGTYAKDGDAYLKFTAQIAANDTLAACGANTLKNTASVTTGSSSKSDEAIVAVDKTCQAETKPQPQPEAKPTCVYTCDSLTVTKTDDTHFTFDAKYTVQNAEYIRTDYIVRDASGKELYRGAGTNYTQATSGTYSVEALVIVRVDGTEQTAPATNCKKQFTVAKPVAETTPVPAPTPAPVTIKVCDLTNYQIVDIKESDYAAATYSKTLTDCDKASVCRLDDKKVISIYEKNFDSTKYSRSTDDCQPAAPVTTTPKPEAIASTGPETIVSGLIGSGVIGLGISSYVRSRRALQSSLLGQ